MTDVPGFLEAFYLSMRFPPLSKLSCQPVSFPCRLVTMVRLAILQIDESASPRNPKLLTSNMSSNSFILDVVPLLAIISKSFSVIPEPLSLTSNPFRP